MPVVVKADDDVEVWDCIVVVVVLVDMVDDTVEIDDVVVEEFVFVGT